jgi:choline dehydrogenase-like flavoprotein
MLHTSDFLTVDQNEELSVMGPRKALSLNDFYCDRGKKLGTVQSAGLPPTASLILSYLRYMEQKDPRRWRSRITTRLPEIAAQTARLCRRASVWRSRITTRLPEIAAQTARLCRRASVLSTIVEDLPYNENRVLADSKAPSGRRFDYTYTPDLLRRNSYFRKQLLLRIAPRHRARIVTAGRNNLNYGHVCGTCRFGDDPRTSVLDKTNRAHDLDNLYVVDASFFPSSGGTNPSLTIAANALRVAEIIHRQLA